MHFDKMIRYTCSVFGILTDRFLHFCFCFALRNLLHLFLSLFCFWEEGIADIVCGLKNVELLGASLNVELEEFQYVPGSIMGRVEGTVQMADGYGGRYIRELTLCYCGVRWEVNTERLTLLFM